MVASDWWLVSCDWWLVIGDWWLVTGDWWLVTGDWWLMAGDWWLVIGDWWLVIGDWWSPEWDVTYAGDKYSDRKIILLVLYNLHGPCKFTFVQVCAYNEIITCLTVGHTQKHRHLTQSCRVNLLTDTTLTFRNTRSHVHSSRVFSVFKYLFCI